MTEDLASTSVAVDADGVIPTSQIARELRKVTSWRALIRLSDGQEFPCIIRDASKNGAKLIVPAMFPLARKFLVTKVDEPRYVLTVSLVWRRENYVGVTIDRIVRHNASIADAVLAKDDDRLEDAV